MTVSKKVALILVSSVGLGSLYLVYFSRQYLIRPGNAQNNLIAITPYRVIPTLPSVTFSQTPYDMSVLLISYHMPGHTIQSEIVKFLSNEFPNGPQMTKLQRDKSLYRKRNHPKNTKCAQIVFRLGTLSVQQSPDLFCSPEILAKMFLEGGTYHGPSSVDKGTKIIHLVQNPFSLSVSNYQHLAQKRTKDNFWTKHQNPCQVRYGKKDDGENFADLVLPALHEQTTFPIANQIVSRDEFDRIADACYSIFQNKEVLKDYNFHQHLLKLEWAEGLRLATAQLIIQGYENGGDILRMANNIVKLKETESAVKSSTRYREINKMLQVYTLSLDDFIEQPGASFKRFLDHIFDHLPEQNEQRKIEISAKFYQKVRDKIMERSRKGPEEEFLITEQTTFLRDDHIFGPPLKRIELLVGAALQDSAIRSNAFPETEKMSFGSSEGKVQNDICC